MVLVAFPSVGAMGNLYAMLFLVHVSVLQVLLGRVVGEVCTVLC